MKKESAPFKKGKPSMREQKRLAPEKLTMTMDPSRFSFKTTDEIEPLEGTIGQERGVRAINFALSHGINGYNCYVSGPIGTGKMTTVMSLVRRRAKEEKNALDWVYVNNFDNPGEPLSIGMKTGIAKQLASAMDDFIKACRTDIPDVFTSEDYANQRAEVVKNFEAKKEEFFKNLAVEAQKRGFAIQRAPTGLFPIPLKDGKPLEQQEFQTLPEDEQEKIRQAGQELTNLIEEILSEVRGVEDDENEALLDYDRKVSYYVLGKLLDPLMERHKDETRLSKYLNWVKRDIVRHIDLFKKREEDAEQEARLKSLLERYRVNVFVDNSGKEGSPVVFEDNPNYYNLFGAIEYRNVAGNMVTDFSKIKPGSIHKANGGYLVIPARELLTDPFAWEALKRTLLSKEAKIENISEKVRGAIIETLRPSPIPVDFKVILIGSPQIYGMLHELDEDFRRLFKVRADFDVTMPRTADNETAYARFVTARCRQDGLRAFDRNAVARIVEYGSRLAEDQKLLSTLFLHISDIVTEASFWAMDANSPVVRAKHVKKALDEKIYRSRMYEEKLENFILRGTILIDVDGEKIGEINGLTVMSLGDYSFGKPVKITARTWLGKSGVMQIERETRMSGPIHNKGVLIISGYLGGKFAQSFPMPLSASLTFEQLYDEVEGDSASSAELYSIISSIAGIPLSQSIAVTGSVNQIGKVQPIGGANEKIEGFFGICKAKGLTSNQGVMIPESNLENLMLKEEVVDAVRKGEFHIWTVGSIEEGIEILTGVPAKTVFAKVESRLKEMNESFKQTSAKKKK
ncbi:AAA family ATPase [bacterium]|nr:AAA family ATPase [bacterium]